ncbi:MAG: ASKHA domain-containing protein [Anaerolineae bacterium]
MSARDARRDKCIVVFRPSGQVIEVETGTIVSEAAKGAGVRLNLPCGGQGRCGRCLVVIEHGNVSRRPSAKLPPALEQRGYALGCQTVIKGDAVIFIPEQEEMERIIVPAVSVSEKVASPEVFRVAPQPSVHRCYLELTPPSLEDNTADLDRLRRHLSSDCGFSRVEASLPFVRQMGRVLRDADWKVTATVEERSNGASYNLIDITEGDQSLRSYGVAIDIGTTSNVVHLVDLRSGRSLGSASTYNAQISCGEDIISRIIYSRREGGLQHLQSLVLDTLNGLIQQLATTNRILPSQLMRATVAGNTTMIQLFLGIDPQPIRLAPYIPVMTHAIPVKARELGLRINPEATVDCLPSVGAYVGADITAGVLSSGMADSEELSLFIDIGTNGEMALGNRDFLVCCACSAGPAFEGSGVRYGMRAAAGAIDAVWIDERYEPTWRVLGNVPPRGICGSGMISLLAEMFAAGVIGRSGRIQKNLATPRVRMGEHGAEYVVAWASETGQDQDIVLTEVDIENLIRTKAAIYAGFTVLLESVGTKLEELERVMIGGAFGQYIDVEKSIQIGLLPDLPWDRFHFLGNTSVAGAYQCLANRERRRRVDEIGAMMTYLELSADNRFMDAFTAAMFLPHTDIARFPSVQTLVMERQAQ